MDNDCDYPFRIAMAILFAVMLSGALRFRLRSHTKERLDRRQEGLSILIPLRLLGLITWVSMVVWMVRPEVLAFARVDVPDGVRWAGIGVGLCCFLWVIWVFRSLGSNLTDTVVTREKAYLVTAGPYRWIRHPLYTGVIPMGVFVSLVTATWWFAAMTLLMFALLWLRTAIEERHLVARFGESYRDYMNQTGRFLPRV